MKVDTSRLKKGTSELTPECRQLIEEITKCKSKNELLDYLEQFRGWVYGKCELYHWIELLDRFDTILADASKENPNNGFALFCDTDYTPSDIRLLLYIINFTTMLIEHSFSRHLYNSVEYLSKLLTSTNMDIVMCVLNLLYMFSKRSNFIPRLSTIKKVSLLTKLYNFAESWGGKDNGFSLTQCCKQEVSLPVSSSTLYFEYYNTGGELDYIEVPDLGKLKESAASIAKTVCDKIPHLGDDQRMYILTRIRLAATFRNYRMRLQFVQARLQAISVLVYSNALLDNVNSLLYPGFLEELVELLEMKDTHLVEIRAAAIRTLTSIIHLDRNPHFPKKPGPRLSTIIEVTGAGLYHGFLPILVRTCINHLISLNTRELDLVSANLAIHQFTYAYRKTDAEISSPNECQFPLSLATALFSFLYHLASYESGGEALISCGMMESLLQVINWPGVDLEHITFVTRAVRVIDLITSIDMHTFHSYNGLYAFIQRLDTEINHCRKLQIEMKDQNVATEVKTDTAKPTSKKSTHESYTEDFSLPYAELDIESAPNSSARQSNSRTVPQSNENSESYIPSTSNNVLIGECLEKVNEKEKKLTCAPQRAALLKSMLNFLKKTIQDSTYNNGMRHIMETNLQNSLRNIIKHADYYGPSLFLLATDVITVYVFQEPSLLSTLQDSGLTNIILQSLLCKEVPPTREVLGSIPNIFSALCLNLRGLNEFTAYQPFDRLFKVLLSPNYLIAMRRRRSSDPLGDTATNLGNAMDDLIKHHPSLQTDAIKSIIKLLNELVRIGTDARYICWRANSNGKCDKLQFLSQPKSKIQNQNKSGGNGNSCDDDDDDEDMATREKNSIHKEVFTQALPKLNDNLNIKLEEREPIPLIDYILNVMKFLEAIISNSTNGEHCREFVTLGGLKPLLSILSLPNLPVDYPVVTTAQAVATVCKSILNLAHETKIIDMAISELSKIIEELSPFIAHINSPEGSILLKELSNCPHIEAGFSTQYHTPLLHAMNSVHGYIVMLVQISRSSQNDIRILLLRKWGVDCTKGKKLLQNLVKLYTSLVWESTILLGMCSEEYASREPGEQTNQLQTSLKERTIDEASIKPTMNILDLISHGTNSTPTSSTSIYTDTHNSIYAIGQTPSNTTQSFTQQDTMCDDNMEIDDDVVCVTPLSRPSTMNVARRAVTEAPDETISIDTISFSSSHSEVYTSAESGENREKTNQNRQTFASQSDQKAQLLKDDKNRHMRFIKALLAASSRLGRALAELFGNLVKLCVGTPSRQRRNNDLSVSKFPNVEVKDIAKVLSHILVNGFCYDKYISPSIPKLKLTFLICSVGFTGPMLFDEKRYAFHLMLSQFCEEGGLEAFFDMFKWALTYGCEEGEKNEFLKSNVYPEGTGEFLDAWLLLLEKMVNPRAIFESPHYITFRPTSGPSNQLLEFEPIFYMIKVHSLALDAISHIWDKKPLSTFGVRIAESILTIMKHILKNESMLRHKFNKRREELKKIDEEKHIRKNHRDSMRKSVNLNHLKLFMDMGFPEIRVSEALAKTDSIEQATDYLLDRPDVIQHVNATLAPRTHTAAVSPEIQDNEEGNEIKLNEETGQTSNETRTHQSVSSHRSTFSLSSKAALQYFEQESKNRNSMQLLDSAFVEKICTEALDKTFIMIDHLPETLNSGAEFLAVLFRRHNSEMKESFLLALVRDITDWTEKILHSLEAKDALNASKREDILIGSCGMKMFIRLKIACLLLDETYRDIRKAFCATIIREGLLSPLIMLVHKVESILQEQISLGAPPITPRWLQHLMELIDAIDNACMIIQRETNMLAVTTKTWKWFDSSAGKWNSYSNTNNGIIHKAFLNGERSVRITCGRQKYTINFNCMSQVNESTGNHRPIIPELKINESSCGISKIESSILTSSTSSDSDSDLESQPERTMHRRPTARSDESQISAFSHDPQSLLNRANKDSSFLSNTDSSLGLFDIDEENKVAGGLLEDETKSNVNKIIIHEEPTGLQQYDTGAIVSCLVRLLRPKLAINLDTINSILKLCVRLTKNYENAKIFSDNGGIKLLLNMRQMCGYTGFPTYAILLIRHTLEEPLSLLATMERVIASRTISAIPNGHRDIIFVLRQMSSAVARDPKIFLRAALNILRLDNVFKGKSDCHEDPRLIVKASTLTKKASVTASIDKDNTGSCSRPCNNENEIAEGVIIDLLNALVLPCVHFPPPNSTRKPFIEKAPLIFGGLPATKNTYMSPDTLNICKQADGTQSEQCCGWHIPSSNHLHDKPLLTRSTVLKILADAIRSYQTFVPKLVIEHRYTTSHSVLIENDQSALSFILDNFLPQRENSQDRDVSTMARVLVTSLFDCIDQLSIQNAVIVELKAAIQRAKSMPECIEKHMRLRVFVGLLPTMIENRPQLNKIASQIILRKGIMSDLAKMVLYLDLSNPNSIATLNAVLKPMETLLRLTVSPGTLSAKKKTSQLQSSRYIRDHSMTAITNHINTSSERQPIARRHINILEGDDNRHIITERIRPTGLFFAGDLARTDNQFNHIFNGILENDDFINRRVMIGQGGTERNISEVLNQSDNPNADIAFEISSESSESESNASEDNDDQDAEDDDANEEQGEAEADEESRQFIEVFDNAYSPTQPRSSYSDRQLDGIPVIRYSVSSNLNETNNGIQVTDGVVSGSSRRLSVYNARLATFFQPRRLSRRSNTTVITRSFNPIQQRSDISIGMVRSSGTNDNTSSTSSVNNSNINNDLIDRFNYYVHHGQPVPNAVNLGSSSISNGVNSLSPSSALAFSNNTSSTVIGGGPSDIRTVHSNIQRDSRRMLFVDQQYCALHPFNNSDDIQNELSNQDALHWWLEEAKNLDMESQPGICLAVAHQIIPFLREHRNKIRRKKRNEPTATPMSTEERETVIPSDASVMASISNATIRRSAIPVLVSRNVDQRDMNSAGNGSTTNESQNDSTSHPETSSETYIGEGETASRLERSLNMEDNQIYSSGSNLLQQINTSALSECMSVYPDDDDDEDEDDGDDHQEHGLNYYNDDENENVDEGDEEEDPNVEDVIMDFDDEIQNVLAQFSASIRSQTSIHEHTSPAQLGNESTRNSLTAINSSFVQHLRQPPISHSSSECSNTPVPTNTTFTSINTPSSSASISAARTLSLVDVTSGGVTPNRHQEEIPAMTPEVREELGDLQVPEGVDPSFLAALPAEMREEVINEHLRVQRSCLRDQQCSIETGHESLIEVNPDFLAALPPNIQAEVLSQQRIEQQRQAAQTVNPNDPVDTAAFFQNLQPSLRHVILTDMEDSQISSLPPELVAEAQNLRRDWEHRNQQAVQQRLTNQTSLNSPAGYTTRRMSNVQHFRDRPSWSTNSVRFNSTMTCPSTHSNGYLQQEYKPIVLSLMDNETSLLDVDALGCLLLMLFIEDSKFNIIRLHRVIRHLCYHAGTREWIINSLIEVIKMADETDISNTDDKLITRPQYLNLRIDAALGYRSSVFLIKRGVKELFQEESYCGEVASAIRVHPQAAQMICRNTLDLLMTLARHFPKDFIPFKATQAQKVSKDNSLGNQNSTGEQPLQNSHIITEKSESFPKLKSKKPKSIVTQSDDNFAGSSVTFPSTDTLKEHPHKRTPSIFEVLLKLDCTTQPEQSSKEAQTMFILSPQSTRSRLSFLAFEDSPFAELISLLPLTVIKRSQQLTDKLVRLLSSLGTELPREDSMAENDFHDVSKMTGNEQSSTIPASILTKKLSKDVNPFSKIKKTLQVIDVHDSESESEEPNSGCNIENEDRFRSFKNLDVSSKNCRLKSLYPIEVQYLKTAIEVLTTKSCSEEGLEYATELIMHMSQCSRQSNVIVVQLLIRGIMGLAELVRDQVVCLMKEVKRHNSKTAQMCDLNTGRTQPLSNRSGIVNNRFTSGQVIISASTKSKPTCEIQLPSMNPLLMKSSSQTFLLRTLKVFMQIRELREYRALLAQEQIEPLSKILCLDKLWDTLSECLINLEMTNDQHAILILQPTVEAFFLIHASKHKSSKHTITTDIKPKSDCSDPFISRNRAYALSVIPNTFEFSLTDAAPERTLTRNAEQISNEDTDQTSSDSTFANSSDGNAEPSTSAAASVAIKEIRDHYKFLDFAEKHRTVLNQILRQSNVHLSDGPFSVLVDHTRILDFDVKRKYFRTELERLDEGVRREELTVNVRRVTVFEDSFRELYRRGPEEWKNRFYIVFEDEEGQDAGGLLREWYVIISREIFNPMYALFCVSPGDRVTYMINPSSHANPNHLCYFKFVGRVIAKAIHDNKLLECYFTRSFYKHILGIQVKYTDMESQDYEFYKGLVYLMNNDVSTLGCDLTFSTEVQEFGVTQIRDLIPNGRNIPVTEQNKFDYIRLVCQLKMSGSIRTQLNAFLEGFYDIIPKHLISIFNEQELELLISGLPNVDIEDLKQNTEYHKYNSKSPQIQWFWRTLRGFDQADRAKLLQFVTGTSKVPLQGFSALEGMNGIQKFQIHRDDRSTDRLPCAHTCFNQLDLPLYKSFEKLRSCLTKAIHECSEGFGFA